MPWWRDAVIYQVYPRSFADSDGDGVGDLRGVRSRLDYLEWLGVDAVWLNPVYPSPNADWGYDVADFCDVDPELGTLDELDALVADAAERRMRVLLDLVPNHTSNRHPWFRGEHRDWYVWADRPNNWESVFGGSAWTFDEERGHYYLHNFLPEQPDLDWWNDDVRAAFDEILRFWLRRGIAGFRIDVAHGIVKDRELRDNPPGENRFNMHRPEVHDVLKRFRRVADELDPPGLLIGETWVELDELPPFYGDGDELHMAMNFPFALAAFSVESLRGAVETSEASLPAWAWPVWMASNHDIPRFPTRWAGGDEARVRCALLLLLTLRGTPILYYGDELGLPQVEVPRERVRDPVALVFPERGRDGARTPMQWSAAPGGGFTAGEPWLPMGDLTLNVEEQRADPFSTLSFCRDLLALRRATPALRSGAYGSVDAPDGVWAWRRGEAATLAVNLSERVASVDGVSGVVRLDTRRRREGETVSGKLGLEAGEGVLVLPQ